MTRGLGNKACGRIPMFRMLGNKACCSIPMTCCCVRTARGLGNKACCYVHADMGSKDWIIHKSRKSLRYSIL